MFRFLFLILPITMSLITQVKTMASITMESSPSSTLSELKTDVPFYRWHNPDTALRGVVIAVHGTTQQAGCFTAIANSLADKGFDIIAIDLRGHGRWFFTANSPSSNKQINYKKSIQDLINLSTQLRALNPRLPIFCIGESVGAAVVVRATSVKPDLFNGIALVSPGTVPRLYNWRKVTIDFLKGIVDLNKPLDVSYYIKRYSSEDPRITHEMMSDPLSRTTLTGKEILRTGHFIRATAHYAHKLTANISVLILQGSEDGIVRPSSAKAILKNIPSSDKQMVVIPSCGHILLGTAYLKPLVINSLTNWLNSQTNSKIAAAQLRLPTP